jgi:sialate O-acetylesterase
VLTVRADVICASLFTDHMVLQRDQSVPIWGTAQPFEKVAVEFAGQHRSASAGKDGRWLIRLKALKASADPRVLVVRGHNRLEFTDVLVGDVWFCSGQSNMEKPLGPRSGQKPTDHYEEEIRAANHPLLRLFQMPHFGQLDSKTPSALRWLPCTPEAMTQTNFSAAAYYFGRELTQRLNVPVGLIHSSFGGTMIEAWMPDPAFDRDPRLTPLRTAHYPAYVLGVQATELYHSMIAPLVPYAVKGFLWYQGEANCMCAEGEIYAAKMKALIATWRVAWNEPAAPFYYVQLAPFDYSRWDKFPALETPEALPIFRDAQTSVLATVPHTGQVITTDLVTNTHDIHPTDKRDVGLRLANLALVETYGHREVVGQSPQFGSMHPLSSGQVEVTFMHAGQGLHWSVAETADDFEIAGSDRHFVPAHGEVSGDKVILSAPTVAAPVAVRFGWNEVAKPHLFNSGGLPVVPFRTDDWPVPAERPRPAKK